MTEYESLSFSSLVSRLNELSVQIDELDEKHKTPFFYKTYEMREFQWGIRQKLVAEFNPMFREYKRRINENDTK